MIKRYRDPFCSLRVSSSKAFTLIELLIVIGILGALATLVMSSTTANRTELIDNSVVQAELTDIQRAFLKFQADCIPNSNDYKRISKTGIDVLMQKPDNAWSFPPQWDNDRQKGWRGPYLSAEGSQTIDASTYNCQTPSDSSSTEIKIVKTPYANDDLNSQGHYYRVVCNDENNPTKLWIVMPKSQGGNGVIPSNYNPASWKNNLNANDLTKAFENDNTIYKRLLTLE